jgi:NADPH-dependent 2,4-dienoyl-CoA reductase/sulfur reductase-like enzyme
MCIDTALSMGELCCTVNPWFGREAEYKLAPAETKKKVLVVGGGPAGMEAARVLAERGHQVTLCEKEEQLGGQLILASVPPHKDEIEQLNKYLARQLEKFEVSISLGTEATEEWIDQVKPDVVVLATGVNPFFPQIPGIEGENVVLSLDVLAGKAEVGDNVAIIGGELVGCETADYLTGKGKQVTVMRRSDTMAAKMNTHARENLLGRLKRKDVGMLPGVQYEEITKEGVVISYEGKKQTITADTIVIATGSNSEVSLLDTLQAKGLTVYTIGDCTSPGRIADAIRDAAQIGGEI